MTNMMYGSSRKMRHTNSISTQKQLSFCVCDWWYFSFPFVCDWWYFSVVQVKLMERSHRQVIPCEHPISSSILQHFISPNQQPIQLAKHWSALASSNFLFLSDPGVPGVRSMGPVISHSKTLLQVMQVIQVIDSLQVIDSIQRRWPFLVAPSGGQTWN